MKACTKCSAWIPDEARFCPSCGGSQDSGGPSPPAPVESTESPPPAPRPEFDREAAAGRVRTLGTLYVVLGALLLAMVALSFFRAASGATLAFIADLERQADPAARDLARALKALYLLPWFLAVSHVVPFGLGVVCVWAGTSLRSLHGRTLGLVAAALMIVLGPCSNCCCCFSAPLGLYALFVLTKADSELVLRKGA